MSVRARLLPASLVALSVLAPAGVLGRHAVAPVLRIQPLLGPRVHITSGHQPPTTQQCEQTTKTACYSPAQIRQAYDLGPLYAQQQDGTGRTIAIVDSFGSPTIREDLKAFDSGFGIPAPPSFKIIHPAGKVPPFSQSGKDRVGWAYETTLDVEWAHAIAPGANILLVETPTDETESTAGFPEIVKAENFVIRHRLADVITQSFGATEQTFPSAQAIRKLRSAFKNAHAHHITVLASTGDTGATSWTRGMQTYYRFPVTSWPATDPLVTALGGTQLHLDAQGDRTQPDNAWNDTNNPNVVGSPPVPSATGGGFSSVFVRPAFQTGVENRVGTHRGVPDVSMSAACDGAVLIYIGLPGSSPGYSSICGTSESAPLFAGVVAIADQVAGHALGDINSMLYALASQHAAGIVDITAGDNTVRFVQNGHAHTVKGYPALTGYDLSTGVGTIDATQLVRELAQMSGVCAISSMSAGTTSRPAGPCRPRGRSRTVPPR